MPQNLREKSDYATPAANVMSFAFMTRSAALCDKPDELLKSISEETAAVKRGKLSIYFTAGLETLRGKKLLETVLRRPWCFSTAVLTNVGDPTRRFGADLSALRARTGRGRRRVAAHDDVAAAAPVDASRLLGDELRGDTFARIEARLELVFGGRRARSAGALPGAVASHRRARLSGAHSAVRTIAAACPIVL